MRHAATEMSVRSDVGKWLLCAVVALGGGVFWHTTAQASPRSQALYSRGLVPFNAGQWDQALQFFNDAVQADSRDALAIYYRGLTRARRGEVDAAVADVRQALTIDENLPHAYLDLGVAQFSAGNTVEAKDALERAYKQGNERTSAAFFLGLCQLRLGELDAAVRSFKEAENDPELRAAAHYYAGLALTRQGKQSAARTELEQTAKELPQSEIGSASQRYLGGESVSSQATMPESTGPWHLRAGVGFEYDSNVSASPNDSTVRLKDSGKSDGRAVFRFGGTFDVLDSPDWLLDVSYDFYQSVHFSESDFDLQGHSLRASFQSRPGFLTYGVVGNYNYFLLDFSSFYQEALGTPWITVAENDWTATQAYYTIRGRDFLDAPYNPGRDAINHAFGFKQYFALGAPDRRLSIGYQYDIEDTISNGPMGRDFQYKGNQIDVQFAMPIYDWGVLQAGYTYKRDNYDNPNRGVFAKRTDDGQRVALSIAHPVTDYLSTTLSYIGIFNGSNLQDFEYDRHIVAAGLQLAY